MERPDNIPADYPRIQVVESLSDLFNAQFDEVIKCLLLPRALRGDFNRLANRLDDIFWGEGRVGTAAYAVDELEEHARKSGDPAAIDAAAVIAADMRSFSAQNVANVLVRLIRAGGYGNKRSMSGKIHNFHEDGVVYPFGRGLCVYNGPGTEFLRNEDALREGGSDIFQPRPGARLFTMAQGALWRQAGHNPDLHEQRYRHIPPFIHRAPQPGEKDPPRLILVAE